MVTPATEASKIAFGHFSRMFDPGKNGLQLTDDFVMRLKDEFASNDPNVIFSYVPFQDDDVERLVEMCSLKTYLQHNVSADTRHTRRWSERGVDPMLCNGGLAFFTNCTTTLESLRLWAHERTPGIQRNVDLETVELCRRCAQVCFVKLCHGTLKHIFSGVSPFSTVPCSFVCLESALQAC